MGGPPTKRKGFANLSRKGVYYGCPGEKTSCTLTKKGLLQVAPEKKFLIRFHYINFRTMTMVFSQIEPVGRTGVIDKEVFGGQV